MDKKYNFRFQILIFEKIIVNFNELKNNTFETIKNICSILNVNFVEAAQNHVQANLSKFGE